MRKTLLTLATLLLLNQSVLASQDFIITIRVPETIINGHVATPDELVEIGECTKDVVTAPMKVVTPDGSYVDDVTTYIYSCY